MSVNYLWNFFNLIALNIQKPLDMYIFYIFVPHFPDLDFIIKALKILCIVILINSQVAYWKSKLLIFKFQNSKFSQATWNPINQFYVYDLAHFVLLREIMWKFHNLNSNQALRVCVLFIESVSNFNNLDYNDD